MKRPRLNGIFLAAMAAAALASVSVLGQATTQPAGNARQGDPYELDVCVVSGEKLGSMGDAIVKMYDGREIRFCCGGCIKKFEADPATYWKKVDAEIIKRQMPYYPVDTCIVSGETLGGEMGEPVDYVVNNRLVRFCCKGCIRGFKKDPAGFLKKLDAAIVAKQGEHYPLKTCPVSGEALDTMGGAIEKVVGNRLVRFCCKGCLRGFDKNPSQYIATLDAAWMKTHGMQETAGAHGAHADADGQ